MTRRIAFVAKIACRAAVEAIGSAWIILIAGCNEGTQSTPRETKVVIVEAARAASDDNSRIYAAVVKPRIEAIQSFRVGGRIAARLVDVGDHVRKGQVLAALDATDWALNVQAVHGQLEAAIAQRDNARADLTRYEDLTNQKLMSHAELDRQQHAVAAAEAQVAALTAQAKEAENKLGYAQLRADADGVVTQVIAEPEQVVSEGAPVLAVARSAEREVEFSVPEQRRGAVQRQQAIQVCLWSNPETWLHARVRWISPAADAATRAFTVRATVAAPPSTLGLGMTASVQLDGGIDTDGAVSLPIAAVFDHNGTKSVWIVDTSAGSLRLATVQIGGIDANRFLVTSGIRPGELVVTTGVHRLTATDHVAVYAGGEHPTRLGATR